MRKTRSTARAVVSKTLRMVTSFWKVKEEENSTNKILPGKDFKGNVPCLFFAPPYRRSSHSSITTN